MAFKKFSLLIIIRTVLAITTTVVLTFALTQPGYHATTILLLMLLVIQFAELIRFVSKTNAELVRFLDAARYADYSQRFDLTEMGAGFEELGVAFTEIINRIQTQRSTQEEKLRHIKAVIEHVPVPLISIYQDGRVTLWNNGARRLFGAHSITKIEDLAQFDRQFPKQLRSIIAGERRLISINIDDMEHRLSVSATQIITADQHEVLLSLQDIQSELALAQIQAWQDLVSVLTHEIMNSITPVASLASTTVDLVEDLKIKVVEDIQAELAKEKPSTELISELTQELDDVLSAVQTVARRSDGLMHFVTSYRRLTRLPVPNKKLVSVSDIFKHVQTLAHQNGQHDNIALTTNITPSALDVSVDNEMIEQILINLVQNAQQALENSTSPRIDMNAFLNSRGHVVIEVADNGEGVASELASQIFVPFFTTKKEGSGVGLALARQVMLAHDGKISLRSNQQGGATFSLTF